ncbi:MAG: C39 family peptidase [Chloroflexi bacterium]|nr:C39 family peptidase [Chloroflexota bacterium]
MSSNRTDKTSTAETQRLSSTVPNDIERLGPAGSLDMPLRGSRRRRRAQAYRRGGGGGRPNWLKALLAMFGVFAAFGLVALVIFIIAFPPFVRDLEPRYQQRLIDMFPPFESLRPTVPFEVLPTLGGASDSSAAQQLLLTQQPTGVTPGAEATIDLLGSGGQTGPVSTPIPTLTLAPTSAEGGIPVGAVPTSALTEEPTPLPSYSSPTPATAPVWTPVPAAIQPTDIPLPSTFKLSNIRYEQQGWNNCGPTTLTMALSYFGWSDNQETAAHWLKPNTEDKNVSPWQMVRYVNDQSTGVYSRVGVKALYRIGGNITLLKRLLAAGFPVIIEESIQPENDDWMGHYVLLIGYDDYAQNFLTFDSFLGSNQEQGRPNPYSTLDEKWRHFNRVFIVIYRPDQEFALRTALGNYVDPTYAYQMALETARAEADQTRDDEWAWFNMGTAYTYLKVYDNASYAFDEAQRLGLPWRMLWYQFGPYEAYLHTERYGDILASANATIGTTEYVEESYYWQGMAYAAQGDSQSALSLFGKALSYNRNFFPAQEAKAQVESGTFTVASASP